MDGRVAGSCAFRVNDSGAASLGGSRRAVPNPRTDLEREFRDLGDGPETFQRDPVLAVGVVRRF
ncbi:MAG: hypothetical protein OXU43_01935 [Gammaproteobacteria bacterium]|nr:hypothetical protein [Gammaproteobacteria bacterium]